MTVSQTVLSTRWLNPALYVLRVTRPNTPILAGQCFSVGTTDLAINREYSIFSGTSDDYLEFLIRAVPGGAVSTALGELGHGESAEVSGPFGAFTLPDDCEQIGSFLLVGSGTGIAPFVSFLRSFPSIDHTVVHGVRHEDDLVSEFLPSGADLITCISREEGKSQFARVTEALKSLDLSRFTAAYLCGNRAMIVDAVAVLRQRGFDPGRILMETFF